MYPFMINSPIIEYPLSGNVTQDIETSWFARMKGIPEVEREIVTEVWSYGEQLGTLTDVLLQVVDQIGVEGAAVEKLRSGADEMKAARARVVDRVQARREKLDSFLAKVTD